MHAFDRVEFRKGLLVDFLAADFRRRTADSANFFGGIANWRVNKLTHGYPKQVDGHSCSVWVAYVASAIAAQTSALNETDQYAIRKKLFNFIYEKAKLPRIAIPKNEIKTCPRRRREWIEKGANIDRFIKFGKSKNVIKSCRLVPVTKNSIDLIDVAEALPKAEEETAMQIEEGSKVDDDVVMRDANAEHKEIGKNRKRDKPNSAGKKKKKSEKSCDTSKSSRAPLPPLPPPADELQLPNLNDVFTRRISVLRYIPRGTSAKVRDALNRTFDLFNNTNSDTEQVPTFTHVSMFTKCILAYPQRAVGNQGKVFCTRMVLDRLQKWCQGEYAELWTEVCAIKQDPPSKNKTRQTSNVRRCKAVARQGNYGKEAKALCSSSIHDPTLATLEALKRKHP